MARPPVPHNSQTGFLHFPVTCRALGFYDTTLDGVYTATAPIVAEANQQVYYNDINAALTIPASLTTLASTFGVASVDTRVFIDLALTNSNPSIISPFPDGLWSNNTKLTGGSDTVVSVPSVDGILPSIGPVTLGQAGTPHTISLGTIKASLYFYNTFRMQVLSVDVTCPPPTPNANIGLVNVIPPTSNTPPPPFSPATGKVPRFPPVPTQNEAGCFSFDNTCQLGTDATPFILPTITCGSFRRYYNAGSTIELVNVTAEFTFTDLAFSRLKSKYAGARSITFNLDSYEQSVTNAVPTTANGLLAKYSLSGQVPAAGDNLTLILPQDGSKISFGTVKAGLAVGSPLYVGIGEVKGSVLASDTNGAALGTESLVCNPNPKPFNIFVVPITVGA